MSNNLQAATTNNVNGQTVIESINWPVYELEGRTKKRDLMRPPNSSLSNRCFELSKRPPWSDWGGSWKLQSCAAALIATYFFAFSSVSLADGKGGGGDNNGGHMSGQNNDGNRSGQWGLYRNPFWSPWYPGYAGTYDCDYSYTPTPEQAAAAKKRVNDYLIAVQKGRRRTAVRRYIAVETLRPTKKQLADYQKNRAGARSAAGGTQLSNRSVEPGQLRCVMVFDVQSKQFVGSGCYLISSLPPVGTVAKFDTLSAEYAGTTTP
jgi:hypothetical protein